MEMPDDKFSSDSNWYNYYVLVPILTNDEVDSLEDIGFKTEHYGFVSRVYRRKNYVKIQKK